MTNTTPVTSTATAQAPTAGFFGKSRSASRASGGIFGLSGQTVGAVRLRDLNSLDYGRPSVKKISGRSPFIAPRADAMPALPPIRRIVTVPLVLLLALPWLA